MLEPDILKPGRNRIVTIISLLSGGPFWHFPQTSVLVGRLSRQNAVIFCKLMLAFETLLFWSAAGFAGGVIFASFFEWALHRYIMHLSLIHI